MSFVARSILGPDDLVLCAGTVPDTDVHERVEVARVAGYRGVGLRSGDCLRVCEEDSLGALRTALAARGLEIGELDGMTHWAPRHHAPGHRATGQPRGRLRERHDALWRVAEEVGARTLNVIEMDPETGQDDEMAEAFAALCDRAVELGMLVQLEPLPWTGIPDLAAAARIIRLADRPNGGLCVDTWHLLRAGQGPADLTLQLTDLVVGLQVNDAPAAPGPDLLEETQHHRLLPGAGDAQVVRVLATLREAGCRAPIGVEVMSDELAQLPAVVAATLAAEATRAVLAEAAGIRSPRVAGQ